MKDYVCGFTFLGVAVIGTAVSVYLANSGVFNVTNSALEDASAAIESLPDPAPNIHPKNGGTLSPLPPPEPVNESGVYSPWARLEFENTENKQYYYRIVGSDEFKRLASFEFIKQTCEIEAYYVNEYGSESSHIFLSYTIETPEDWAAEDEYSYQNKYAVPLTEDVYKEINFFDFTQDITLSFYIDKDMYNAAIADNRHFNDTYSDFIVDDVYDKALINSIVESYTSFAEENGYTILQTLNGLAALGQSAAEYGFDDDTAGVSGNYIRFGIESLLGPKIDCEDYAILLAELFNAAGYRSAIFCSSNHAIAGIVIPQKVAEASGLVATELNSLTHNGDTYFLVEGTGSFEIGAVDLSYKEYQEGGEFVFCGEF